MKPTILLIVLITFLIAGCASNSDVIYLDNRISELERQNEVFQKHREKVNIALKTQGVSRDKEEQDIRELYAKLRVDVESLKKDYQALSGRIEEIEYLIEQHKSLFGESSDQSEIRLKRIEKTGDTNADRILRLEQYLGFEASKTGDPSPKQDAPPEKKLTEEELYKVAKEKYDQADFEGAREHFQKFLTKYPQSKTADNAQFWIGEIYYQEKWYEKAILEYQNVIEKYPKGNKVPAALLKQGLSFQNLKQKANARLILKELLRKFPKSNEAKVAEKILKDL